MDSYAVAITRTRGKVETGFQFRLTDGEFDALQVGLEVFNATTTDFLLQWFPELEGHEFTCTADGNVTVTE